MFRKGFLSITRS